MATLSLIQKSLLFLGVILSILGVALGAFGAHALKTKLQPEMLAIFEVGVRYQMYHAFAIIIAVGFSLVFSQNWPLTAGFLFVAGTLLFSGSLYALTLTGIKTFGAITPIGGLLFLIGWLVLAISIVK